MPKPIHHTQFGNAQLARQLVMVCPTASTKFTLQQKIAEQLVWIWTYTVSLELDVKHIGTYVHLLMVHLCMFLTQNTHNCSV